MTYKLGTSEVQVISNAVGWAITWRSRNQEYFQRKTTFGEIQRLQYSDIDYNYVP